MVEQHAVGYMRRSHDDNGGQLSREDQEVAIAGLAAMHGVTVTPDHIYADWGRSGGDAPEDAMKHRPKFRAMVRAVERGEVSYVLALRLDRLGRGQSALGTLWAAAEKTKTRIVTRDEGDLSDADDPTKWLTRHMLAGFAEYYLKEQKRKAARTLAFQKRRRDDLGLPAYGYSRVREPAPPGTKGRVHDVLTDADAIAQVLDAYREAGSYLGAAKRLTAARVPVPMASHTRLDGKPYGDGRYADARWAAKSVRDIVMREAPTLAPREPFQRRAPVKRPRLFAGLLRCHCGHLMTPGGSEAARSWSYFCNVAHGDADHVRPYTVSEKRVLAWAIQEAAHLRVPVDAYTTAGMNVEAERTRLTEQRRRAGVVYQAGGMADDEYLTVLAGIDADLRALAEVEAAVKVNVPASIDWTADVRRLNEALRTLWRHVDMAVVDDRLTPVSATWLVPEWRA